jgi:hypothetical protein
VRYGPNGITENAKNAYRKKFLYEPGVAKSLNEINPS